MLPVICVSSVSVTLLLICCQHRFKGKVFLKAVTNMLNFTTQNLYCIANIINLSCTFL